MGVSLDEQSRMSLYEMSELLAVDDVYQELQKEQHDKLKRESKSGGRTRGKLGGGGGR